MSDSSDNTTPNPGAQQTATTTPTSGPTNQGQNEPNFTLWLVLGVLDLVICSGLSVITGVATIVLSLQGQSAYRDGRRDEGHNKLKLAKISFFIGLALKVLGLIAFLIALAVGAFGAVKAADTEKGVHLTSDGESITVDRNGVQINGANDSTTRSPSSVPMNEKGHSTNFDVTGTDFKCSTAGTADEVSAQLGIPSSAVSSLSDQKLCTLHLKATNVSSSVQTLNPLFQALKDSSADRFSVNLGASAISNSKINQVAEGSNAAETYDFAAGQTKDIVFVYNVPQDKTPTTAEVTTSLGSSPVTINL